VACIHAAKAESRTAGRSGGSARIGNARFRPMAQRIWATTCRSCVLWRTG
jgi:hypothetical protein